MHLFVLGAPILFLCQQKLSQLEKLPTWRKKMQFLAIFGWKIQQSAISSLNYSFGWYQDWQRNKEGRYPWKSFFYHCVILPDSFNFSINHCFSSALPQLSFCQEIAILSMFSYLQLSSFSHRSYHQHNFETE